MTAEEMFKELGYKKYELSDDTLCYKDVFGMIIFKKGEDICIKGFYDMVPSTSTVYINKYTIAAINKQIEELGW